jgi:hypothetical protein
MDTEGKNPKQCAARWAIAEKAATEKYICQLPRLCKWSSERIISALSIQEFLEAFSWPSLSRAIMLQSGSDFLNERAEKHLPTYSFGPVLLRTLSGV